jgi:hypothetical protein
MNHAYELYLIDIYRMHNAAMVQGECELLWVDLNCCHGVWSSDFHFVEYNTHYLNVEILLVIWRRNLISTSIMVIQWCIFVNITYPFLDESYLYLYNPQIIIILLLRNIIVTQEGMSLLILLSWWSIMYLREYNLPHFGWILSISLPNKSIIIILLYITTLKWVTLIVDTSTWIQKNYPRILLQNSRNARGII